jgi:hypothetical protein
VTARADHAIGLTPLLKRQAFHFLLKGAGEHASIDPAYDKVVVRLLYDWQAPADADIPSQGAATVEFWRGGQRVRWVDFGCRVIGGGGPSTLRLV